MAWWGDLELEDGQSLHVVFGALDLWVTRQPRAWRVFTSRGIDRPLAAVHAGAPPLKLATERELMVPQTQSPLNISPALPDRAVVARPTAPLYLPAGESAELFLNTPLWLRLADEGRRRFLYEAPSAILQDTWLGRSPTHGELCYVFRPEFSIARPEPHPARVLTKVLLTNSGSASLSVERIALPAPHLGLFADDADTLWTPALSIAGDKRGLSVLDVASGPGREVSGARPVAPPRNLAHSGLARIYDAMFG